MVLVVVLGVPALMGAYVVWDASYQTVPLDTEAVSAGARRIRDVKTQVQDRLKTELKFGTDGDTGRLRAGAARVFLETAAPTVLSDNAVDAGLSPSGALDAGRLWVDTTNIATTGVQLNYFDTTWKVAAPSAALIPQYAIILWDNSSTCPPGYTEATEFRNLAIRGADVGAVTTTIPDTAGVTCNSSYATTNVIGCGASNADAYADVQTDNTLFQHTHTEAYSTYAGIDNGSAGSAYTPASASQASGKAGQSVTWPGPFRTVLFCRKSA